jgi:hypothetical protein
VTLLAYRFLGWRVGPDHREWVHDDITRRGWVLRQGAPVLAVVLLLGGLITAALDASSDRIVSLVVVLAGVGLFLRRTLQERALRQQGLDASGNPVADWYGDDRARLQRNVLSAVSTTTLVVGGLVILALRSRWAATPGG